MVDVIVVEVPVVPVVVLAVVGETTLSDSGDDGGLSSGALAAIIIGALLIVGATVKIQRSSHDDGVTVITIPSRQSTSGAFGAPTVGEGKRSIAVNQFMNPMLVPFLPFSFSFSFSFFLLDWCG